MRQEIPRLKRYSLASLMMFVTIVALALAQQHWAMFLAATVPFLLTGLAVIVLGWRAPRHQLVVRTLTTIGGLALIAVGVYATKVMWPG